MTSSKNKVAIFVCNDLTGLLILNQIVPGMKYLGYEPVIFHTGDYRNSQFKIPTPPVVSFFNTVITRDVIIPTLESQQPALDKNCSFRQLSARYNLEYQEIDNVNDPILLSEITKDDGYCGGIALRFLQVFGTEAINIFHEKGFLWNLHSGLLPRYKGLLTPFRAIENGDQTYGMTLHDLTAGIDEGDVIQIYELPLDHTKPILDLYMDAVPVGTEMILSSLVTLKERGVVDFIPQKELQSRTYYTNPTSQEFRNFMTRGIIYADPYQAIERIVKLFSVEGTSLHISLKRALLLAVSNAVHVPPAFSKDLLESGAFR
ncbi:MAG TPA: formyltransferase family protein [Niabella sp.]|nr:formyltransferase family protein [Niabella sp.]